MLPDISACRELASAPRAGDDSAAGQARETLLQVAVPGRLSGMRAQVIPQVDVITMSLAAGHDHAAGGVACSSTRQMVPGYRRTWTRASGHPRSGKVRR
jgi:hypothetical protein